MTTIINGDDDIEYYSSSTKAMKGAGLEMLDLSDVEENQLRYLGMLAKATL